MSLPATLKWVLLALAGLAIAIGVAIAAANLTSRQIGIASESVSAGDSLAPSLSVPAETTSPGRERGQGREEAPEATGEENFEAPTAPAPSEETAPLLPAEPGEPSPETGAEDRGHGRDGDD